MQRHNYGTWLALATLLAMLLGTMFKIWGDFTALTERMDEADQDRHEIIERLERLEQLALTARPAP